MRRFFHFFLTLFLLNYNVIPAQTKLVSLDLEGNNIYGNYGWQGIIVDSSSNAFISSALYNKFKKDFDACKIGNDFLIPIYIENDKYIGTILFTLSDTLSSNYLIGYKLLQEKDIFIENNSGFAICYYTNDIKKLNQIRRAEDNYNNGFYLAALNEYERLNKIISLSNYQKYNIAKCHLEEGDYENCINYLLQVIEHFDSFANSTEKVRVVFDTDEFQIQSIYYNLAYSYNQVNKKQEALLYYQKAASLYDVFNQSMWADINIKLSLIYDELNNTQRSIDMLRKAINKILTYRKFDIHECWSKGYKDPDIASMLYWLSSFMAKNGDSESEIILKAAAMWGSNYAKDECKQRDIEYYSVNGNVLLN